jgi:hypothetical protein
VDDEPSYWQRSAMAFITGEDADADSRSIDTAYQWAGARAYMGLKKNDVP